MRGESVSVVAAVIRRRGRYLLGRRPAHKRHGGLWEFPGGKVREGESVLDAARRELAEELTMDARSAGPELFRARDEASPFTIHFVEIEARGEPKPLEHSEVRWLTVEELSTMPLAPADAAFVRTLAGGD